MPASVVRCCIYAVSVGPQICFARLGFRTADFPPRDATPGITWSGMGATGLHTSFSDRRVEPHECGVTIQADRHTWASKPHWARSNRCRCHGVEWLAITGHDGGNGSFHLLCLPVVFNVTWLAEESKEQGVVSKYPTVLRTVQIQLDSDCYDLWGGRCANN